MQCGFSVVRSFLSTDLADHYRREFWSVYAQLGLKPLKLHGGMIQYIGHSRPQWELRHLCAPLFAELWDSTDLVTSFDGFCAMDGNWTTQRCTPDSFLHRDQKLNSSELLTYQGLVNLADNPELETGGFVCVAGSHKLTEPDFSRIFGSYRPHTDHWYPLNETEKNRLYEAGYAWSFVPLGPGDFLIWDTRLLHCNTKCYKKNYQRVTSYICMVPRPPPDSPNYESIKKRRELAARTKRCARHYPWQFFKMFPREPRFSSAENKLALSRFLGSYDLTRDDTRLI